MKSEYTSKMDYFKSMFKSGESKSFDETNGLIFNDVCIPEEILMLIISNIDLKNILNCSLVCKKWNDIIKSSHLWRIKCKRAGRPVKNNKLPWYVYYCFLDNKFENLLLNGNGQDKYNNWKIVQNGGDGWKREDPPQGADQLPANIPEFNGYTGCFATSFGVCAKVQKISLEKSQVLKKILDKYQPTIYISEWYAGRFDCGCMYNVSVRLLDAKGKTIAKKDVNKEILQWEGSAWSKVELTFENYGKGVSEIVFKHKGSDTLFWKGHYGSKMAGGVVKILLDSIETT